VAVTVFSVDTGVSLLAVVSVVGVEPGGLDADGVGVVNAQARVKINASRMGIMRLMVPPSGRIIGESENKKADISPPKYQHVVARAIARSNLPANGDCFAC
jgi:hypothetical protein